MDDYFCAALMSGEFSRPTQKECRRGNQLTWSFSELLLAVLMSLLATEATRDESRPPDSSTPHGTSDIILRFTAFSKAARSTICHQSNNIKHRYKERMIIFSLLTLSYGLVGLAGFLHRGLYQEVNLPTLLL